jgi:prepilin-type N-terminal cleavage/methylation domain-containing protein
MNKEQGFSLVELLMVVVIIGVIAALAIPGLQRARRYAQAGSAIQSLRTITTAENLYERRFKTYATLAQLAPEGTIDPNLAIGHRSGYTFTLTITLDANEIAIGKLTTFKCYADPDADPGIVDHFYVDETAVIRHKEGAPADATSDPIPK